MGLFLTRYVLVAYYFTKKSPSHFGESKPGYPAPKLAHYLIWCLSCGQHSRGPFLAFQTGPFPSLGPDTLAADPCHLLGWLTQRRRGHWLVTMVARPQGAHSWAPHGLLRSGRSYPLARSRPRPCWPRVPGPNNSCGRSFLAPWPIPPPPLACIKDWPDWGCFGSQHQATLFPELLRTVEQWA